MINNHDTECRRTRGKDTTIRSLSDRKSTTTPNLNKTFYPQALQRLSLAIINHAVCDLLDKGRYSPSAERWLLSREFDRLQELLKFWNRLQGHF